MTRIDKAVEELLSWAQSGGGLPPPGGTAGLADLVATGLADFGVEAPLLTAELDGTWVSGFFAAVAAFNAIERLPPASARLHAMAMIAAEHGPYHVQAAISAAGSLDQVAQAWEGTAQAALRVSLAELLCHLGRGFAIHGSVPHCGAAGRELLAGAIEYDGPGHYTPPPPSFRYVGDETAIVTLHFGLPIFVDLIDDSVSPEIIQQGWWEPWIDGVLQKVMGRGDIAVNVGANLGYHVLRIAHLAESSGRMFAFEPNPRILKRLSRTIRWSGLIEIATLFPFAASDTVGKATMTVTPEMSGHGGFFGTSDDVWRPRPLRGELADDISLAVRRTFSPRPSSFEVETRTLDETVGRLVDQIHLLMIDAEQAEPLVLDGGRDLIARSRDLTIIVEWMNGPTIAPSSEMRSRGIATIERLAADGFAFWNIDADRRDIFAKPAILEPLSVEEVLRIDSKADLLLRRRPGTARKKAAIAGKHTAGLGETSGKAPVTGLSEQPPPIDLSVVFHSDDLQHFQGSQTVAETRVYNWYAGYGAALRPKSILEIGVRRGYGAYALIKGAGGAVTRYVGVDMELDIGGTNATAEGVVRALGVADVTLIKADTRAAFPPIEGAFDLIHIDGDHSMQGALSDLCNVLPLLMPAGTIIMDDAESPPVRAAVDLARTALSGRATFTTHGDLHTQVLIRAIDANPLALSFHEIAEAAEPKLKGLLTLEPALQILRAPEGRSASEARIAAQFGDVAKAVVLSLDLVGVDRWRTGGTCQTADDVLAALADLVAAFSSQAQARGIMSRPWEADADEHGRYALARLADVKAPALLAGTQTLPGAFTRGSADFTALLHEMVCNLAAIFERAVHRLTT